MRDSTGETAAISKRLYYELQRQLHPDLPAVPEVAPDPGVPRVLDVPDAVFRAHKARIASRRKRNKIGAATRARQRAARP